MLECTWKTCCLITTINRSWKVTSDKLSVLFSMEPSTLLQNIEWKYSEIKEWQSVEVPTAKLQEFLGPILLINKFQMLITLEIQVQFQKCQLRWAEKPEIFPFIKFREFWWGSDEKFQFCWITWHGIALCSWSPSCTAYFCNICWDQYLWLLYCLTPSVPGGFSLWRYNLPTIINTTAKANDTTDILQTFR